MPRTNQQALITDVVEAEQQVIRLVEQNLVMSLDDVNYGVAPGTICIHGDGVNALSIVSNLRFSLKNRGVQVGYPKICR